MNTKDKKSYLSVICDYRSQLMGFAILWVMLFHSRIYFSRCLPYTFFRGIGYGGVDIFMLVSGIGLYFSLHKNSDPAGFYKRRILRLFPSYIPALIVWFACSYHIYPCGLYDGIRAFTGNLTMTGWLMNLNYQYNWYVQAILFFYLLTPIIYAMITRYHKCFWKDVLIIIGLCLFGIPFLGSQQLMAVSRIPIFVMGLLIVDRIQTPDYLSENGKRILHILSYLAIIPGFVLLWLFILPHEDLCWRYGIFWYPFLLITPAFCEILARLFAWIDSVKVLHFIPAIFRIIGESSFEIYLLHIITFSFFPRKLTIDNNIRWLALCIFSVIIGILYQLVISQITKWIRKRLQAKRS